MNRRTFLAGLAFTAGYSLAYSPLSFSKEFKLQIGVQTYSFRDLLPQGGDVVGNMINQCKELGITTVELFEPTIQPPEFSANAPWAFKEKPTEASLYGRPPEGPTPTEVLANRDKMREWRMASPLSYYTDIAKRFSEAGIKIHSFNFGLKEYLNNEEVLKGIAITKALGTNIMTASTTIKMAERVTSIFEENDIILGVHGHSNLHDPNHFATPESFDKALAMSPNYMLNLDLGHFAAAGFDCVAFVASHACRIVSVHLKDRQKNNGKNMPYGEGDTPLREVLQLIRERQLNIPAMIEYEYAGGSSLEELKRIQAFIKSV